MRRTYTVRANAYLLAVRATRKQAIDLMFAASVAAATGTGHTPIGRNDFKWSITQGGGVRTKLPNGTELTCERDDLYQ